MTSHRRRRKSETMPYFSKDRKHDVSHGKEKSVGKGNQKSPLPLSHKSVYIDVKNGKQSEAMEDQLKKLGAVVEKFLSREVNYVISSSAPPTKTEERHSNEDNPQSPSFANVPSPFSSIPSPTAPSDSKALLVSRGKALAQIAYARNRASTVVANAEKWGIKVVSLEAASKWLDRELKKLEKEGVKDSLIKKENEAAQKPKKKVVKRKKRVLKGSYIKFEAMNRMYRPVKSELDRWPRLNLLAPPGLNSFTEVKMKVQDFRNRRHSALRSGKTLHSTSSGKGHLKKSYSMSSVKESASAVTTLQVTPADVVAVPITTTGDVKRHLDLPQRKRPDKLQGYCESCRMKYKDMNQHVKEEEHQTFARDKSNYESLDVLIKQVPSTYQFLQDILLKHCAQKQTDSGPSDNDSTVPRKTAHAGFGVQNVISPLPSEAEVTEATPPPTWERMKAYLPNPAGASTMLESEDRSSDKHEDWRPHAVVIRRPTPSGVFVSPRRREPTPSKKPWMQERSMVFRDSPMASLQISDVCSNIQFNVTESVLSNPFNSNSKETPTNPSRGQSRRNSNSIVRSLLHTPDFESSDTGVRNDKSYVLTSDKETANLFTEETPKTISRIQQKSPAEENRDKALDVTSCANIQPTFEGTGDDGKGMKGDSGKGECEEHMATTERTENENVVECEVMKDRKKRRSSVHCQEGSCTTIQPEDGNKDDNVKGLKESSVQMDKCEGELNDITDREAAKSRRKKKRNSSVHLQEGSYTTIQPEDANLDDNVKGLKDSYVQMDKCEGEELKDISDKKAENVRKKRSSSVHCQEALCTTVQPKDDNVKGLKDIFVRKDKSEEEINDITDREAAKGRKKRSSSVHCQEALCTTIQPEDANEDDNVKDSSVRIDKCEGEIDDIIDREAAKSRRKKKRNSSVCLQEGSFTTIQPEDANLDDNVKGLKDSSIQGNNEIDECEELNDISNNEAAKSRRKKKRSSSVHLQQGLCTTIQPEDANEDDDMKGLKDSSVQMDQCEGEINDISDRKAAKSRRKKKRNSSVHLQEGLCTTIQPEDANEDDDMKGLKDSSVQMDKCEGELNDISDRKAAKGRKNKKRSRSVHLQEVSCPSIQPEDENKDDNVKGLKECSLQMDQCEGELNDITDREAAKSRKKKKRNSSVHLQEESYTIIQPEHANIDYNVKGLKDISVQMDECEEDLNDITDREAAKGRKKKKRNSSVHLQESCTTIQPEDENKDDNVKGLRDSSVQMDKCEEELTCVTGEVGNKSEEKIIGKKKRSSVHCQEGLCTNVQHENGTKGDNVKGLKDSSVQEDYEIGKYEEELNEISDREAGNGRKKKKRNSNVHCQESLCTTILPGDENKDDNVKGLKDSSIQGTNEIDGCEEELNEISDREAGKGRKKKKRKSSVHCQEGCEDHTVNKQEETKRSVERSKEDIEVLVDSRDQSAKNEVETINVEVDDDEDKTEEITGENFEGLMDNDKMEENTVGCMAELKRHSIEMNTGGATNIDKEFLDILMIPDCFVPCIAERVKRRTRAIDVETSSTSSGRISHAGYKRNAAGELNDAYASESETSDDDHPVGHFEHDNEHDSLKSSVVEANSKNGISSNKKDNDDDNCSEKATSNKNKKTFDVDQKEKDQLFEEDLKSDANNVIDNVEWKQISRDSIQDKATFNPADQPSSHSIKVKGKKNKNTKQANQSETIFSPNKKKGAQSKAICLESVAVIPGNQSYCQSVSVCGSLTVAAKDDLTCHDKKDAPCKEKDDIQTERIEYQSLDLFKKSFEDDQASTVIGHKVESRRGIRNDSVPICQKECKEDATIYPGMNNSSSQSLSRGTTRDVECATTSLVEQSSRNSKSNKSRLSLCKRVYDGEYSNETIDDASYIEPVTRSKPCVVKNKETADKQEDGSERTDGDGEIMGNEKCAEVIFDAEIKQSGKRMFNRKRFHTTKANWEVRKEEGEFEIEPAVPNVAERVNKGRSCTRFNHAGQYANDGEGALEDMNDDREQEKHSRKSSPAVVVRRFLSTFPSMEKRETTWCKVMSKKDWSQSENAANFSKCQMEELPNPSSRDLDEFTSQNNEVSLSSPGMKGVPRSGSSIKHLVSSKKEERKIAERGRINKKGKVLNKTVVTGTSSPRLRIKIWKDQEKDCYSSTLDIEECTEDSGIVSKNTESRTGKKKEEHIFSSPSPLRFSNFSSPNAPLGFESSDSIDLLDTPRRKRRDSEGVESPKLSPANSRSQCKPRKSNSADRKDKKSAVGFRNKRKHLDTDGATNLSSSSKGTKILPCPQSTNSYDKFLQSKEENEFTDKPAKRRRTGNVDYRETSEREFIPRRNSKHTKSEAPTKKKKSETERDCSTSNWRNLKTEDGKFDTDYLLTETDRLQRPETETTGVERNDSDVRLSGKNLNKPSKNLSCKRKGKRRLSMSEETEPHHATKKLKVNPSSVISDISSTHSTMPELQPEPSLLPIIITPHPVLDDEEDTIGYSYTFHTDPQTQTETKGDDDDVANPKSVSEEMSGGGNNLGDLLKFIPDLSSPGRTNSSWGDALDSYLYTSAKNDNDQTPGKRETFSPNFGSFWSPAKYNSSSARNNSNNNSTPQKSPRHRKVDWGPPRSRSGQGCSTSSTSNTNNAFPVGNSHQCLTTPSKRNSLNLSVAGASPAVEKVDSVVSFNHMSPQRLCFSPVKMNSPSAMSPLVQKIDSVVSFNHMSPQHLQFSPMKSDMIPADKTARLNSRRRL